MTSTSSDLQRFYSRGKLMLTGEYLVLKGALSLSLPLQYGQEMLVQPREDGILHWQARVKHQAWFEARFALKSLSLLSASDQTIAQRLQQILMEIRKMKEDFFVVMPGCYVATNLEFDPRWGWGSSSTLVANLAQWATVDPFELNRRIFKGSGYDIACAGAQGPVLFQLNNKKPFYDEVHFQPDFADHLYLVWLNQKQNSEKEVVGFDLSADHSLAVDEISQISRSLLLQHQLEDFRMLIEAHEECMARILNRPTIKEALFPDYKGTLKSLGAWGGDFVLAVPDGLNTNVEAYFKQKGYHTVFRYNEIVKDNR